VSVPRNGEWDIDDRATAEVDETAIDEARDYCETCGRHMPDGGCPACGVERVSPAPAAPFDRSEGSA
jgi:hypothetical protein